MPTPIGTSASQYPDVLAEYLRNRSEDALYRASLLSQLCVNEDHGPEDILALHVETLDRLVADLPLPKRIRAQSDVALALADHRSTGQGLGDGLGAVRRLMSEFEISTSPTGTCIKARRWPSAPF